MIKSISNTATRHLLGAAISDIYEVRQILRKARDTFDDAEPDDQALLSNKECDELVLRLTHDIAALRIVLDPEAHSSVPRIEEFEDDAPAASGTTLEEGTCTMTAKY
jgi:hypothetical protein